MYFFLYVVIYLILKGRGVVECNLYFSLGGGGKLFSDFLYSIQKASLTYSSTGIMVSMHSESVQRFDQRQDFSKIGPDENNLSRRAQSRVKWPN